MNRYKSVILGFVLMVTSMPTHGAGPLPVALQQFLEKAHAPLLSSNRPLFCLKMRKAAVNNVSFFRTLPNHFYAGLRAEPEGAALAQTPVLFLLGDANPKSIELSLLHGAPVPQFAELEDADLAPVGLDLVRAFTSACLLDESSPENCLASAAIARDGYLTSLTQTFANWTVSAAAEKSVSTTDAEPIDWRAKVEASQKMSPDVSSMLARVVGLDPAQWSAFDYRTYGTSGIGARRALFVKTAATSPGDEGDAYEVKELVPSSLAFFTAEPPIADQRPRLERAYKTLRQIPIEAKTVAIENTGWQFRHRLAMRLELNLQYPASAARVLGGLLAQSHAGQLGDSSQLARVRSAVGAVTPRLIKSSAQRIQRSRKELQNLLDAGAWNCNRF